jgi:diaminopimelate decarboxylase
MQEFFYLRKNELYCEELPLRSLADQFGTPLYVYSKSNICHQYSIFKRAFESFPTLVCYSVKSNSNLSIINVLDELGAGMDIISGGELYRTQKAGVDSRKIVFSGPGKTAEEIEQALKAGIFMINIESEWELETVDRLAKNLSCRPNISLRINPDVDAQTHKHTTTGTKENKFGIPLVLAEEYYKKAAASDRLSVVGLDLHLGSPIYAMEPYFDALNRVKPLIESLRRYGIDISILDIGGGFGIIYNDERPFGISDFADRILPLLREMNIKRLVVEPGRFMVGSAGVLVVKVTCLKKTQHKNFIITDGGMNDLIRPAFYDSYHRIEPVNCSGNGSITADVVGPVCESSDYFAKLRKLPLVKEGDLLSVMEAGAYGFSMASNYNSRPRAAEVMVSGRESREIRTRENYEDLIRGESV